MEWLSQYGKFGLIGLLIVVGLIAIRWSKSESKNEDDPEMANVAKAIGVGGWVILMIVAIVVIYSLLKLL